MANQPIDYTPKTIADIVFPSDVARDLIADIVSGTLPFPFAGKNGILLYGTYGTGKSALAKLLPDAIEKVRSGNKAHSRYAPIQQGNNGATVIKTIESQTRFGAMVGSSSDYFILDEVDNLNKAAMSSLKSVMNKPETIFILTTNNFVHIDGGVKDRCHCIAFNAAPADRWLPFFKRVLTDQCVAVPDDKTLLALIKDCNGSARRITIAAFRSAANSKAILQQCAATVVPASTSGNQPAAPVPTTTAGTASTVSQRNASP